MKAIITLFNDIYLSKIITDESLNLLSQLNLTH
jgi:hypothetical protein